MATMEKDVERSGIADRWIPNRASVLTGLRFEVLDHEGKLVAATTMTVPHMTLANTTLTPSLRVVTLETETVPICPSCMQELK